MNLKKLSLAAAISASVLVTSGIAYAEDASQADSIPTVSELSAPIIAASEISNPSSYGAGPAGSFKTSGTLNPVGGNAAGATEIGILKSPTSQSSGDAAGFAAQGVYGNCAPCQTAAPVTPACPVAPVTPACPVTPSDSTGGASGMMETIPSVATPTTSELTGGAAAAEKQGMKCVEPETPAIPNMAVPVCPTGGAIPICPAPTCPMSTTDQNAPEQRANAPKYFKQPVNPGAIAPVTISSESTGGAVPITPGTCTPACPAPQPAMTQEQMQQMMQNMQMRQQMMQPGTCPVPPQPMQQPCPGTSMAPTIIMPLQSGLYPNWQFTGAAAPINNPANATCPNWAANSKYLERQVYAYPSMPGSNVTTPAGNQAISFGGGYNGVTVSNNLYAPGYNYPTGAAAPMLGLPLGGAANIPSMMQGIPVNGCSTGGAATPIIQGTPVITGASQAAVANPISIQTASSIQLQRMVLVPMPMNTTGAAAPVISSQFTDVSSNFWASNEINKLASAGIISGYPDRTFKPDLPVSRAEFASLLVSGLNLQNTPTFPQQIFRDVPNSNWANTSIDKAYNRGLIAGYPNDTFRPSDSVSIAEALTTMSKTLPGNLSGNDAMQILSNYKDADAVPTWARISVAKALNSGLTQAFPNPNQINPNKNATRADIAAMLSQLRQTLALEAPTTTATSCATTGAAAALQQQTMTVPTLSLKFNDRITASASHIGDKFTATTLEPVTVNNVTFPTGSTVNGKIVEVIRPGASDKGALRVAFTSVSNGDQTANLPKEILAAQVQKQRGPNIISRLVEFPFTLVGRTLGIAGRTVGGSTVIAGNAVEQTFNSLGIASSELTSKDFKGAGRSAIGSAVALGKAPLDIASTILSGASGLLNVTSDELAYLTTPDGSRVASINPKEQISIAFGCY